EQLLNLSGGMPSPRLNLSLEEKQRIIQDLGIKTVKNILKAKKQLPIARIPFLFSSIDTQMVLDILHNDFLELIK
ncbi:MAG: hypothetical protein NT027_15810, partial [Proteobacteria bacterium]|nr:hypothetical protein [Pseudomonadota bacterium]